LGTGTKDPWVAAFHKLKKSISPTPKLLLGWQLFHVVNSDPITKGVNARGLSNSINNRNKTARELFDLLENKEKAKYNSQAHQRFLEEKETHWRLSKSGPGADPADHKMFASLKLMLVFHADG
jgi:hypothetical protein